MRIFYFLQDSVTGLYYGNENTSTHLMKEFSGAHLFSNMIEVDAAVSRRLAAINYSKNPHNTLHGDKALWAKKRSSLENGGIVVRTYTLDEKQVA